VNIKTHSCPYEVSDSVVQFNYNWKMMIHFNKTPKYQTS